ncbi:hypothetical protein M758_UG018100 [Ceratodon purpureus]|nr:hypothetical protein M758_UG018100 [Ceratodon purpureus]
MVAIQGNLKGYLRFFCGTSCPRTHDKYIWSNFPAGMSVILRDVSVLAFGFDYADNSEGIAGDCEHVGRRNRQDYIKVYRGREKIQVMALGNREKRKPEPWNPIEQKSVASMDNSQA